MIEYIIGILRGLFSHNKLLDEELVVNNEHEYRLTHAQIEMHESRNRSIICNGKKVPIEWSKVVLWNEEGGLKCEEEQYRKRLRPRKPRMFVIHWDVCLSSRSMAKVLKDRGLSVHFAIDNDGTIYQLMDTQHVAWHAKGVNNHSVGVEISNAVHLRFQKEYQALGFPKRPFVLKDVVHGKEMKPYTGFYPEQVRALKALTKALHKGLGIPYKTPLDSNGNLLRAVDKRVVGRTFAGVVGHYHITKEKRDPGNLALDEMCADLAKEEIISG